MIVDILNMQIEEAVKMTKILMYIRFAMFIELLAAAAGSIYLYQGDTIYSGAGKPVIFMLLLASMFFVIIGANNYLSYWLIDKKAVEMADKLKVIKAKHRSK